MNRRWNFIKIFSLSLMLIFPFSSISAPEEEMVSKRSTVNDDFYAVGDMIFYITVRISEN